MAASTGIKEIAETFPVRIQDYIVNEAKSAADQAFRYARAVPAEKLDWAPENGRSVLSICRELAMTPTWTMIAFGVEKTEFSEAAVEAQRKEQEQWKTVEACEAEFKRRFEQVETVFRGFSDEDLQKTKWLPYNGGRDHTYLEMMDYPRWNCTYHLGQIGYIQTLYGDKENY
jgi:uncharacterized damage-inducible protein DinB